MLARDILLGYALPVALGTAVALGFRRGAGGRSRAVGAPIAAVTFIAGCVSIYGGVPAFPVRLAEEWMPWLAGALALASVGAGDRPGRVEWAARAAIATAFVALALRAGITGAFSSPTAGAIAFAACTGALTLGPWSADRSSLALGPVPALAGGMLACMLSAPAIFLSGSLKLAAVMLLAGASGACVLAAGASRAGAALPGWLCVALWLLTYLYADAHRLAVVAGITSVMGGLGVPRSRPDRRRAWFSALAHPLACGAIAIGAAYWKSPTPYLD